jgi:DNA glycosylase AlkZ-like
VEILDIVRQRLQNERLIGAPFEKPEEVVRWLGAVQAQDYPGSKWAIGQRVKDCVDATVEDAYTSGRILRTHVMRPTWHFVMSADIRWMLELSAPRVKTAMGSYDRKLELDDEVYKRTNGVIVKALQGGAHLTRTELADALERAGIAARGQRLGHIVHRAEIEGLICSGEFRAKQHTYALLEERAPVAKRLTRDEALAELTRRFFTSHGPALGKDFAWWSGLTVADAKEGIESNRDHLVSEVVDGKAYWSAPSTPTARMRNPTVHLLPNYDEYLVAYRERSASLSPALPAESASFYEMFARHVIVLNGLAYGGWWGTTNKNEVSIRRKLSLPLSEREEEAFDAAVERYSRFLGMAVKVEGRDG